MFGSLIASSLGGIYADILSDLQFRITLVVFMEMQKKCYERSRLSAIHRLPRPIRRRREGIEEVMLRVTQLAEGIHEISEVDLNPIFTPPEGQGCLIVDARIRIEPSQPAV